MSVDIVQAQGSAELLNRSLYLPILQNQIAIFLNCYLVFHELGITRVLFIHNVNNLSIYPAFLLDYSCSWYSPAFSFCEPQKWWETRRTVCF